MNTTLIEELNAAAYEADQNGAHEFANRIRQRAAWVRELGQRLDSCPAEKCGQCTLYGFLTGPIPAAETAPTEPPTKETTNGNQE